MHTFLEVVQEIKKSFDNADDVVRTLIENDVETTSIATASHATGSYLIYNKKLYQVIDDIAVGDTLDPTPTTGNIEESDDIMAMLEALSTSNQAISDEIADMNNVLGAKNLLKYDLTSGTYHEVVYTVNSDKTISVTTTEATATARFISLHADLSNLIHGETYILNGCPSGGAIGTYVLYLADGTNDYVDTGNGIQFVYDLNKTYVLRFVVYEAVNLTTLIVFKPMIRPASIQDDTYVPYSMTNREMTPYVQAISNPNLLDNPWFTINQRGASSITTAWTYFVDRWRSGGNITEIDHNADNSITLKSGGACDFVQGIPYSELTFGKSYVLSVMLSNGQIFHTSPFIITQRSTWGVFSDTVAIGNNCYLRADGDSSGFAAVITSPNVSSDLTIKAMKLELGTQSTLSHDTAPNYATELLKCQRYFYRHKGAYEYVGYFNTATNFRANLALPVSMRAIPSMTLETPTDYAQCAIYDAQGNEVQPSAIAVDTVNSIVGQPEILLNSTVPTHTQNMCGVQRFNLKMDLSADL